MSDFVVLKDVYKTYRMGEVTIPAVNGMSFAIKKGELVVIVGPSGAGKTTVLNILGGMDRATSGTVTVDGEDVSAYSARRMIGYRRDDIGFVFQFYNLIQNLTAKENVELALQICKDPLDAAEVLAEVGLADRLDNFPSQLSGGEQQRVAIARALAKNPKLLLCDEPTGALDYRTGKAILKLLQDTCRSRGMTVIIITHNQAITPIADRVIEIRSGTVGSIRVNTNPRSIEEIEWQDEKRRRKGLFQRDQKKPEQVPVVTVYRCAGSCVLFWRPFFRAGHAPFCGPALRRPALF